MGPVVEGSGPEEEIRVVDNREGERYELWVGGDRAGLATYHRYGSRVAILHTEVEEAFEGRGLGGRLAGEVLADIRGEGGTVTAICPFIADYLVRHPEEQDVVDPEFPGFRPG